MTTDELLVTEAIIIEHARQREKAHRQRRGGNAMQLPLPNAVPTQDETPPAPAFWQENPFVEDEKPERGEVSIDFMNI